MKAIMANGRMNIPLPENHLRRPIRPRTSPGMRSKPFLQRARKGKALGVPFADHVGILRCPVR